VGAVGATVALVVRSGVCSSASVSVSGPAVVFVICVV
jgi:hypothetical protein